MNTSEEEEIPFSIKVLEEQLHVEKKIIKTGKVKITKHVSEENIIIDTSEKAETVEVKHVEINKYVSEHPKLRQEGNKIIIPVVKEVLVMEKKLLLVEELHIIKQITVTKKEETVTLKKDEVIINRNSVNNNTI